MRRGLKKICIQSEDEAIVKRRENENILDIKEQIELLHNHLDSVKATGEPNEINKCMVQLMNLKKKYSEITGGMAVYRSPDRSRIMGERRKDREEEEDNVDKGDATVVARDGSPRIGEGLVALIEDQDIRKEMKGVKKTIDAMYALERTQEITRREMREDIFNLQKDVAGMQTKMRDAIEASLENNLTKILECMKKTVENEEERRLRRMETLVTNAGKGLEGIEQTILSERAPAEATGGAGKTGDQVEENTIRVVALVHDSEVQVVEEEQTGQEVPKGPSAPQPRGKEQQQGGGLGPQTGGKTKGPSVP